MSDDRPRPAAARTRRLTSRLRGSSRAPRLRGRGVRRLEQLARAAPRTGPAAARPGRRRRRASGGSTGQPPALSQVDRVGVEAVGDGELAGEREAQRVARRQCVDRELDRQQRPLVLADRELRERQLVVPAQQLPVRLAEAVVDRRREVGPGTTSASDGSRISVIRSRARRRPSRTRSHDVTRSRSARSTGVRPRSASHASTSAGATGRRPGGDGHGAAVYPGTRQRTLSGAPATHTPEVAGSLRSAPAAVIGAGWRVGRLRGGRRAAAAAACARPSRPSGRCVVGKSVALDLLADLHVAARAGRRAG